MNSTGSSRPWWEFGPYRMRIVTLKGGQRMAVPYLLRSERAQVPEAEKKIA